MRLKNLSYGLSLGVLLAIPAQARWGVGLSVNHWEMDHKELDKEAYATLGDSSLAPAQTDVKANKLGGDLEFFYERPIREALGWGVSLGASLSPKSELNEAWTGSTALDTKTHVENKAMSFPLSVYLRRDMGAKFGLDGGVGAEFIKAEATLKSGDSSTQVSGKFKDDKVSPFVRVRGEYKVTPAFSVGLSLKYLFSAELDDFRGPVSGPGISGDQRLIMSSVPPWEVINFTDTSLAAGDRPYKVDMGGLRIGLTFRYAFGG